MCFMVWGGMGVWVEIWAYGEVMGGMWVFGGLWAILYPPLNVWQNTVLIRTRFAMLQCYDLNFKLLEGHTTGVRKTIRYKKYNPPPHLP